MRNALTLSFLVPVILLSGCKDKAADDQAQDLAGTGASPTTGEPETPEPVLPTDAQAITKLSETAISIFEASTNQTQPLEWHLHGESIALRVEAKLSEGASASYDTMLFAQIKGAEEVELFSCKSLAAAAEGRMDLTLRGDMLHVLCINSAQAEDPGATDAKRFGFNLGKRLLEAAGSYGGDGTLDLDTIDLDEGE
jgi:hypothetical protein